MGSDGLTTARWINHGRIRAEILPLGAAVHRFQVRTAGGEWRDLVLSRADPGRNDASYFGATIGRLANRTAQARFVLDGVTYRLPANDGPNHLHGGPAGFADRWWQFVAVGTDRVRLRLVSADGDQGYPGALTVTADIAVSDDGLRVEYAATTDADTVVNLTCHPYFVLGGAGIGDHRLTVPAGWYTPTGQDDLPTGQIAPVAGTALDLRQERLLTQVLADLDAQGLARAGGLNHNLIVDGAGLREHARLRGPDGLTLVVRSDAPAVQLYSAEHLGRAGLAIEPQSYPDAPNQPGFPPVTLRPGQLCHRVIEWLVCG